jgi:hypothetical protein
MKEAAGAVATVRGLWNLNGRSGSHGAAADLVLKRQMLESSELATEGTAADAPMEQDNQPLSRSA